MANFHGTIKEFHDFIGPKITNKINYITRKHRLINNGVCEVCGKVSVLQSAHVHGRDRRFLIESVLKSFTNNAGLISCSLEEVELEILRAHEPIKETFKFICHPCHVKYDSRVKKQPSLTTTEDHLIPVTPEFTKLSRIQLWASRHHQINSKIVKAYLQIEKGNQPVLLEELKRHCTEELSIERFDSHFASMKTDNGNSHGAVFYEQDQYVKIWKKVRQEINRHFT